ncbi:hypothetical protein [Halorarius litoreus]|uniref:hypothetical protein n=1 Tax=Halorarius litoreus TaxID=2962676 RepID=UPI0020CD086B|nr:hypothetical protein [Halorarius litoreus]
MADGQRIDWQAIPTRYRRWQALPVWRKLRWLVTRSLTMVVAYVGFAVAILWYNEPTPVEAIGADRESPLALVGALVTTPELGLLLILVPAVVAAVLLPNRPSWRG